MKMKTLCWAIGLAAFAYPGMLYQYIGLPEWCRWICTAGVLICGAGGIYTTLKEEMIF